MSNFIEIFQEQLGCLENVKDEISSELYPQYLETISLLQYLIFNLKNKDVPEDEKQLLASIQDEIGALLLKFNKQNKGYDNVF